MTARPEIVAVLTDVDLDGSDLAARRLRHRDGRLFSPAETALFFDAGQEELEAAAAGASAAADQATAGGADHRRLAELLRPYKRMTLAQALPLMPAAERAEAAEIMRRLGDRP